MTSLFTLPITIRASGPDDVPAVRRLAAMDSAPVPHEPLVLVEMEGELRAAVTTDGHTAIADPFHRTLELVSLVRDHLTSTTGS